MLLAAAFAFVAGILTILSPCTLPVVPVVLGSSATGTRGRAVGVVIGFAATFLAVTVLLASVLAAAGVTTSGLRIVAAVALGVAGASLAVPRLAADVERRLAPLVPGRWAAPRRESRGVLSGLVLGAAVGVVWAPCVGPITAAVIAAAATRGPTLEGLVVSVAYVVGAAIPLLAVAAFGRRALARAGDPRRRARLQRGFGIAMVVTSLLVISATDVPLENAVSAALPAGWGSALVGVEPAALAGSLPAAAGPPVPSADPAGPSQAGRLPDLGPAPDFAGITAWINSTPLTIASLRGRVVLVEFWTFACINCIHVEPYVKAWDREFRDEGLVVIGVHTPELSFERDVSNVRDAVSRDGVTYPVAFDPSFATWNAYRNRYWPAMYFVDRAGHVRHVHAGEGDYDGSERVIRQLLAEPG